MFEIIVFCILAIAFPYLAILRVKYDERHRFKCAKCHHVFMWYDSFNSYRTLFTLYVKCPKCGQYSAVETIKIDSKTDK